MPKEFKKVQLKTFTNRGYNLTPVEFKDLVPFDIKRMYFFDDVKPDQKTGAHMHYIEEEFFIQAKGSSVATIDRGQGVEDITLATGEAMYCPNYVWHGFKNVSSDAMIIALSSTNYSPDRNDYLEEYEAYLQIRDEKLAITQ